MDISKLCPHCMRELNNVSPDSFCPYCGKKISETEAAQLHHLNPLTILQGKYLVGDVIGEGGFGITYYGFEINLEIRLAIKEFYPNGFVSRDHTQTTMVTQFNNSNAESVRKWKEGFVKEAQALAKCQDLPGIVRVKDFFEENGSAYIVMEYVDGTDLKSYVKQSGKLEPEVILPAIRPIMNSLEQIHNLGVIHRDIAPDNIRMTPDGSMKLMDFGAARSFADADGQKSLSIVLKPGYAPEEQYRTHGKQGPWTDVYALAATIYRCLTGTMPIESMERLRSDTLKSPKELGVKISDQENKAIMKGMAVLSENRYQSVKEFEDALYSGTEPKPAPIPFPKPSPSPVDPPSPSPKPATERYKIPIIAGAAIAVLLLILVVGRFVSKGNGDSSMETASAGNADRAVETLEDGGSNEANVNVDSTSSSSEMAGTGDWKQDYADLLTDRSLSSSAILTLTDVNSDDTPEMIIVDGDRISLVASTPGGMNRIDAADGEWFCAVDKADKCVYVSQIREDTIDDYIYKLLDSGWDADQVGHIGYRIDPDQDIDPYFSYSMDDRVVEEQNYYSWLDAYLSNASPLSDQSFIKCSSASQILGQINSVNDLAYHSDASYTYEKERFFECSQRIVAYTAVETGMYSVEMKGGAGGADGARVLENRYLHDGDGAIIRGSVSLKQGEKLFLVVGGAGMVTTSDPGVMEGGFNGGGASYWSGGGGGSTDLYYRGRRIASAAGAGGGNFDEANALGEPGRTSTDGGYLMYDKRGESTAYSNNPDSGAAGGGGWYGGIAGVNERGGHGGINGYDAAYFRLEFESPGARWANEQMCDGYAYIE